MNKKILLIGLSFFCLSSTYALKLPEQINDAGDQALRVWFWELDDSVDDREDIESNLLSTIASVGYDSNFKVFAYWLDANFKHYQHFDSVIDKVDNATTQLNSFQKYVEDNYPYEHYLYDESSYHILMTESGWGGWLGTLGLARTAGNFAVVSDNYENTAAHEMGHMLGASHNRDTNWFKASIMYPWSGWWYSRENRFWSSSNASKAIKKLSELPRFPYSNIMLDKDIQEHSDTTDREKYNLGPWDKSKTLVYEMSTSSKHTYIIEIKNANFDTYIYIYDDKGDLLASDDDGGNGFLSKLSDQNFGSSKKVYIVVSGFNYAEGDFTIKVSRTPDESAYVDTKKLYSIKALNGTCGLKWDGVYKDGRRNAKFDCAGRFDSVYFEKVEDDKGYLSYLIKAKAKEGTCSLGWKLGSALGDITAIFDCVGTPKPMYLTRDDDGYYYIKTMFDGLPVCGLKVSPNISNGERDAKVDCISKPDPLTITEVGLK